MGWRYQARRAEKDGEVWYELVEAFPDLEPDDDGAVCHTVDAISVIGESKANLAKWLRNAADDVEKYPAIYEEETPDNCELHVEPETKPRGGVYPQPAQMPVKCEDEK